jgi:hypothetical protein
MLCLMGEMATEDTMWNASSGLRGIGSGLASLEEDYPPFFLYSWHMSGHGWQLV